MTRTYRDNEGPVQIEFRPTPPAESEAAPVFGEDGAALVCPRCGSAIEPHQIREWCGTVDRETGYSDIGERFYCACGEKGEPDELLTRQEWLRRMERVRLAKLGAGGAFGAALAKGV